MLIIVILRENCLGLKRALYCLFICSHLKLVTEDQYPGMELVANILGIDKAGRRSNPNSISVNVFLEPATMRGITRCVILTCGVELHKGRLVAVRITPAYL